MNDTFNAQSYLLLQNLIKTADNSGLPISILYYVTKEFSEVVTKAYEEEVQKELQYLQNDGTPKQEETVEEEAVSSDDEVVEE